MLLSSGTPLLLGKHGDLRIVSRPEKDHAAQLDAFAFFRKSYAIGKDVKLVLVGGSRNDGDAQRVANLRKQAQGLGVEVRHFSVSDLGFAYMKIIGCSRIRP